MVNLKLSKKGKLDSKMLNTAILALILLVVVFNLYAALVPEAQTSGDNLGDAAKCTGAGGFYNTSQAACLNGSNPGDTAAVQFEAIPLGGLLNGQGFVFLIIMATLIILIVKAYLPKGK